MLSARGPISWGRERGICPTQSISWERGRVQASAREIPWSRGALASSLSLVPWQWGHTSSFKNFSTRFMPFSSFTLDRAFSTVYTAL